MKRGKVLRQNLADHHQRVADGVVDDAWVLPLPVLQPDSPDLNQFDDVIPIAVHPRWTWWGFSGRHRR